MADVTLNGRTYNGVSTVKIGTATFVEASEDSSVTVYTAEQDYTDTSFDVLAFLTLLGIADTQGYYSISVTNNTNLPTAKLPYGGVFAIYNNVGGAKKLLDVIRNPSNPTRYGERIPNYPFTGVVFYLAQGAKITVKKVI